MKIKSIIIIILIILLAIASGYYYVFIYAKNHHRNIQSEQGITIIADSLSAQYQADEKTANAKYLNKAIVVKGQLMSVSINQQGQTTLLLGNANSFSNTSVTLIKNSTVTQKPGDSLLIKGLCTGFLSDVIITDATIQ
jgi:hypothetical protein